MERITISLNNRLAKDFDALMHKRGYFNRSEALRDLIRDQLEIDRLEEHIEGQCLATLSYIYNHHESELASRITAVQHDHHELTLSSMHVHMDHDNCLEISVLRGSIEDVKDFANRIIATRGIRHGKLHLFPVEIVQEQHSHESPPHVHSNPLT